MSELLSQDEINALLSAFESVNTPAAPGGVEKPVREVRLYDFSKPDRFSKDHLRVLQQIHSNFAAGVASTLSGLYQMPVRVDMVGLDQVLYKEYRASVPAKTLFAEVQIEQFSSDILFEMNPGIVGSVVDCLCGGSPSMQASPSELTPADLRIAERVLKLCMEAYTECWAGTAPLTISVRSVSDSSTYDEIFLATETVLVCSLEVHVGQLVGMMTICIPAAGIESILPVLTAARAGRASGRRQDKSIADGLRQMLRPVSLSARVVLGRTRIRFEDAMSLEVGDVIKMDRPVNGELDMWVGNRAMFRCRPGLRGKGIAVAVTSAIEDSEGLDPLDLEQAVDSV